MISDCHPKQSGRMAITQDGDYGSNVDALKFSSRGGRFDGQKWDKVNVFGDGNFIQYCWRRPHQSRANVGYGAMQLGL